MLIKNTEILYNEMTGHDVDVTADNGYFQKNFICSFKIWFNRNPGLALPLIALQYHEVKINVELENET